MASQPNYNDSHSFAEVLLSDMRIIRTLVQILPYGEAEKISKPIITVWQYNNRTMALLEAIITDEVANQKTSGTLFRSNCVATFLMTAYSKLIGKPYLERIVGTVVKELAKDIDARGFEIDKLRLQPGEDLGKNTANLRKLLHNFMDVILNSSHFCPKPFREICRTLSETVQAKFPESKWIAIGGFIFLRYICPAVVTPDGHKIVDIEISTKLRRVLVLCSKVIQSIVNERPLKEDYMAPLSNMLTEYLSPLQYFLNNLAKPVGANFPSNVPPLHITHKDYQEALQFLKKELGAWLGKIQKVLLPDDDGQKDAVDTQRVTTVIGKKSQDMLKLLSKIKLALTLPLDWIQITEMKRAAMKINCMAAVHGVIWCGLKDGNLLLWDPGKSERKIKAHMKGIMALLYCGEYIWTASEDTTISIYKPHTLTVLRRLAVHRSIVNALGLVKTKRGEKFVISGCTGGIVKFWNCNYFIMEGFEAETTMDLKEPVSSIAFTEPAPGKQYLWIGTYGVIVLIDFAKREVLRHIKISAGIVSSMVAVSSKKIWVCSHKIKIVSYDGSKYVDVAELESKHEGRINCLAMSIRPNGSKHIWSGSFDKKITIWDATTCAFVREVIGHVDDVTSLVASDTTMFSSSRDETIAKWEYIVPIQRRAPTRGNGFLSQHHMAKRPLARTTN